MADGATTRARWPRSPGATLEAAIALLGFAGVAASPDLRALLVGCLRAIADGARSTALLVTVDPATLLTALGVLARIVLLLAPVARALATGPRHRLAWVPLGLIVWVAVLGISLPGVSTAPMWALATVAAALGWLAAKRPALRAAVFLPWLVALEPMLGHSPLSDDAWPPSRLAQRCAGNDGVRPVNLTPAVEGTHYYAVTPATPGLFLLTGERHSFWVRREADGTATLGPQVRPTANLWQGCMRDGKVWVTARGVGICEVALPIEGEPAAQPICHEAPGSPSLGIELDYVDPICPANRPTVYASQLLRGGYLELDPRAGTTAWHPVVPGLNLQMVARADGRIVAITTGRLVVFDPDADQVLEEHAAGTVAMGIDVCDVDGAIAVTDFAGRVRLFERGPDGRYAFHMGTFLTAPRRVAFSPTCDRLVVTSGDDRRAFLLRRVDLQVVRTYQLGPGLRDVVFADDRDVAAADACTVTFLDAEP
jgi:hypothetical protein